MTWFNFHVAWLILGNLLVFGNTDCKELNNTLYETSFGIVIWGYIVFLIWLYVAYKICSICCVIQSTKHSGYYEATKPGSAASKNDQLKLIAKATAMKMTPRVMVQCELCQGPFRQEEQVSVVKCGLSHFFHTQCAEKYLAQHSDCPICKIDIRAMRF